MGIFHSHAHQRNVPASLQYSRQHDCRKICRRGCSGCCGCLLSHNDAFYCSGYGLQHWVFCGHITVVWGKTLQRYEMAISTSYISCAILSISLTIIGFIFSRPMMRLIHTPANIFRDGSLYLNIYIGGLTFLFLYNICTGVFNALGDSRTPLYFLIGSSIGNIVLDLIFVRNF